MIEENALTDEKAQRVVQAAEAVLKALRGLTEDESSKAVAIAGILLAREKRK